MDYTEIEKAIQKLTENGGSPELFQCNQFTADYIKNKCLELTNIEPKGDLITFFGLEIEIRNYFPDYVYQIKKREEPVFDLYKSLYFGNC